MNAPLPVAAVVRHDPGKFAYHPRASLERWPGNPRQHFDEHKIAELAKSISGGVGIIEPLVARPHPDAKKRADGKLEIAAGERRWRAAELAKLVDVPVIVKNLTDQQMLELATIENAQREDLHPLEQAAGYERLIKEFGYTPEKIADSIGKSRAHVFQIRKLRSLASVLRQAFVAGEMDTTLATVVARIPSEAMQITAWQQLKREFRDGFSFRAAADFIRKNYMLDLSRAPFDIKDATLMPKAGTCQACPKRSGNQVDLFADIKNGNVCTDPACFASKRDAANARETKTLQDKGVRVILGKAAEQILPHGSYIDYSARSKWALPADHCENDTERRNWGQLAKLAGAEEVRIQRPDDGKLVPLIDREAVKRALDKKGIKLSERTVARTSAADLAKRKSAEQKARLENEARALILQAIRANVRKTDLISPRALQLVVAGFWLHIWEEHRQRLAALWKWSATPGDRVMARLKGLDATTLARMLVDCALIDATKFDSWGDTGAPTLAAASRIWRVQDGRIRAGVAMEAKAKQAAKAALAKAKAKKAPGKVKLVRKWSRK